MDWFLLLSRMGESYAPGAPPQSCLSHTQRTQLAQVAENDRLEMSLYIRLTDNKSLHPQGKAKKSSKHDL